MAKPINKPVRTRPIEEGEVAEALNREVVPVLREVHARMNQLLDGPLASFSIVNHVERRTIDTTTATTQQLAEFVGTLVTDLKALLGN